MTKFLLRIFVKDHADRGPAAVRARVGLLSGLAGIACNLLLFAGKLVIGLLSGAVSITADAMNNLSDMVSSVVTLLGFKLAERPADEAHPYGHGRYEYLCGVVVAAMILMIGFELAKSSFGKILHPEPVQLTAPMCIVLAGSIGVKLWMFLFNRALGRHIDSSVLMATAADSRNDMITTAAVLLAGILERALDWRVDGYMGFAVALFILYSGVMLARDTISPLLGEGASPELRGEIVRLINSEPLVLGFHDLMVHDYGPGRRFASLHVEMDRKENPLLCHEIIDNLERRCLLKHNVQLVIHYDPVVTDDAEQDALKDYLGEVLAAMDPLLKLHDFRMVRGEGHSNVIFDVEQPAAWKGREGEIRQELDRALAALGRETFYIVVTFDPAGFN